MGQKPKIHIALHIEKSRAHGRQMLAGIADFALAHPDWRFDMIESEQLADPKAIRSFDGLIVRVMDDRSAEILAASGKPVIDAYGRLDHSPFDTIRLDDEAISRLAAGCFAEHRFANCAFCGFKGPRFSSARATAFAAAVASDGGSCAVYEGEENSRLDDTFFRNERLDFVPDARALRKWIRGLPKPIAIFCCNDIRALQLTKLCESEGIRIPEEVAVLGADNDALLCAFSRPPLSSIDTDPFRLGHTAAEMLGARLERPPRATTPRVILHAPRKVVERASTEIFPFRTPWLSEAMILIRRGLTRGITADDVARSLGYSHTAVNNAFRAELGTSVKQEIIRQRLELAKRLLRETNLTAAEIARETGFLNPQYFSRAFSDGTGQPPDAWRRDHHCSNPSR